MNYGLAYRIGFHPWEEAEEQPSFTEKFSALLDREESGRQPPYGPALDVGTGSGIWGIKLASEAGRSRAWTSSARRSGERTSGCGKRAWICASSRAM